MARKKRMSVAEAMGRKRRKRKPARKAAKRRKAAPKRRKAAPKRRKAAPKRRKAAPRKRKAAKRRKAAPKRRKAPRKRAKRSKAAPRKKTKGRPAKRKRRVLSGICQRVKRIDGRRYGCTKDAGHSGRHDLVLDERATSARRAVVAAEVRAGLHGDSRPRTRKKQMTRSELTAAVQGLTARLAGAPPHH
jgi:hypothetical protein